MKYESTDEQLLKRLWWYTWRGFVWVIVINTVAYFFGYKPFDWGIFFVSVASMISHRFLYPEEP